MNDQKFTFLKKYKDEKRSSVSSWHMAHISRYKEKFRKSLKQVLADFHFCTQWFSFFPNEHDIHKFY